MIIDNIALQASVFHRLTNSVHVWWVVMLLPPSANSKHKQKIHCSVVCVCCLNCDIFIYFQEEGVPSTNAHLSTQTHIFRNAYAHKWEKNTCIADSPEYATHTHLSSRRADTWLHAGECNVYATWCMWTGSVNKVKRVWWLREPEHMHHNPIYTASKTNNR